MKQSLSILALFITTLVLVIAAVIFAFFYPDLLRWYLDLRMMPSDRFVPLLVIGYGCIACGLAGLALLIGMLSNIRAQRIFVQSNARLLGWMSACCLAIALLTGIGTVYYPPFVIFVIAALFLFFVLRVVGSVFARAVALKDENDMTI